MARQAIEVASDIIIHLRVLGEFVELSGADRVVIPLLERVVRDIVGHPGIGPEAALRDHLISDRLAQEREIQGELMIERAGVLNRGQVAFGDRKEHDPGPGRAVSRVFRTSEPIGHRGDS